MRQMFRDPVFWTLVFFGLFAAGWYVFLYIMPSSASAQTGFNPAEIVKKANGAEVAWYKNPTSPEAEKEFKRWVAPGPVMVRVTNLIAKARQNGSRLEDSSYHAIDIVSHSAEINGREKHFVITRENSRFIWSSGKEWRQQDNPHKYTLEEVGGQWKVVDEEFKY